MFRDGISQPTLNYWYVIAPGGGWVRALSKRKCNITHSGNASSTMASREAAQNRIDQIAIFERELAQLRTDRVIDFAEGQLAAMAAYHRHIVRDLTTRYDADASESGRQLSMSMRIVSIVGAFAIGSTVFVIFYHFWAGFNVSTQTALLCAAPTSSFIFALLVGGWDRGGYFSRISAALCYASFVLAVVVLPRLWNINLGSASVLSCTVFGFVLAYEMRSRLQLCAALVGVLIYGAALMTLSHGAPWWSFAGRPENSYPSAVILLIVPSLVSQRDYPDFGMLYRFAGAVTLFGTCLTLSRWPSLSYLHFGPGVVSAIYKIAIVVGGGAGIYIGLTRRFPEVSILSGIALLLLVGLETYHWLLQELALYQAFLIVSALAIGALSVLAIVRRRVTNRQRERPDEA